MKKMLAHYKNGNAEIVLFEDGTRIIQSDDDKLNLECPLNIDCKLSNKCSVGCAQCHEDSVPNGDYAELSDLEFFRTMQEGAEIAYGGGSLTEYPYLREALELAHECKLFANCTFHCSEVMNKFAKIKTLQGEGLIYGMGISISVPASFINKKLCDKINQLDNVVLHVINGLFTQEHLDRIVKYIKNPKILILGYKDVRRGKTYHRAENTVITQNQNWLFKNLESMQKNKRIKCISFDNLAIKQLQPQRFVSKDKWDELFQGEDGTSTMYVDAVKKEFAVSSTCMNRHPMTDDIKDMFEVVKREANAGLL